MMTVIGALCRNGLNRGKENEMDRNKAIEHLKIVLKTCDVQDEEAVEMAIKALEETHTLNGNTLTIKVSENDIDKVKRVMLDCAPWCRIFYEDAVKKLDKSEITLGEFEQMIVQLRNVIQPKHGKWNCTDDIYETAECSYCKWNSGETWEYTMANFNFCPNCGADMRCSENPNS